MGTPDCSFSPYFKVLLFSLLLALLSCCRALEGRKATTEAHFDTLEISSLLPASVCIHSKGSNEGQSTLKVVHRHGPCFQHSQEKSTPSEILTLDQSRVKSIQARLESNSNTNKFNNKKAKLPVQPKGSFGSGNYIVTVGLGTPKKTLNLVFDTGSDLTWTQCQPCAGSCYQQQDPIFNPSSSSSFSNISCSSPQCSQLTSATSKNLGCSSSTCVYGIQYGDKSFTIGFFSKDTLTISSKDVVPNFLFGCGQNNQGFIGKTAGLIGLGRDRLSLVSQTATKYGKYFSYCLPSTSSSTGHLTLGKTGAAPQNVKFTPFASSQGKSFYFIDIIAISVGGTQLSISQSVFQTAGTIIDSGTVITRLPPSAYSAMRTTFKKLMQKYPSAPGDSLLDTCFDFSNYKRIEIPTISFTFGGNQRVDLPVSGRLFAISLTQVCLAFAGNGDASDVGIFGNTQQQTLEVVYDVAGGKLGFGAGGCK